MDFTILLLKPIAPPFTVCPGPHPLLRSGVRPQNLNLMCYAQLIPGAARNPGSGGRDGSSSSSSPACRVLLESSENSLQPSCSTAQSRRGMHCSFLPHPASSSLGGMDEKQQSPELYFRIGKGGGRRIQDAAALPSQGHRSQAAAKASMQSSFNREFRPILPLIFSLAVR